MNKAGLNEKLVLVAWLWIPSYDLEEQSMARSGYWLTPLTFIVSAVLVILARRIARTAWSIYTHKTEFDSKRLISALT